MAWNYFRMMMILMPFPRPNFFNLAIRSFRARYLKWASLRSRIKSVTSDSWCKNKGLVHWQMPLVSLPTITETPWKVHYFSSTQSLLHRLLENVYSKKIRMLRTLLSPNCVQLFASRTLNFLRSLYLNPRRFYKKLQVSGVSPLTQMRKWLNHSLLEVSSYMTLNTEGVVGEETNIYLDRKPLQITLTESSIIT